MSPKLNPLPESEAREPRRMFVSYAQNFEDVMLWRAFRDVEQGFYVDLGAQDPLVDSVSLAFHERGWRGVHVEPSPSYAAALRRDRPNDVVLQAAVGDGPSVVTFFEIADSGISTVDPSIAEQHRQRGFVVTQSEVPSIPLSAVLEACPSDVIHWLKIDVEGSERSALASWGISTRRPWIVVVESTLPLSQIEANDAWEHLLVQRDYRFVYFDGLNRFYVAAERSELESAFRSPPNVFDAFAVNGTASSWIHRRMEERYREEADQNAAAARQVEAGLRLEIERQHEAIGAIHRQGDQLADLHAEQLRRADERLLEESRMLNGHIRALLAELQQRQVHALEERERLNEAHRQILASLETAVADARVREQLSNDARANAQAALHDAQADLEGARRRHALELERLGAERQSLEQRLNEAEDRSRWLAGEIERERFQASAAQGRIDELHRAELARLGQSLESQARDAHRIALELGETRQELERLQAFPLTRLWRSISPASRSSHGRQVLASDAGRVLRASEISAPGTALVLPSLASDVNMKDPLESVMLDQLLALNDVDFVRAAYRTLLKREADPAGEQNYVGLLRSGHDKVRLLGDMASSEEAVRMGTTIAGLNAALVRRKIGRIPIFGPVALKVGSWFSRAPDPDPAAALLQQLLGTQRTTLEIVVQLQATVQKMQHQQMSMDQTLRRLSDREGDTGLGLSTLGNEEWSMSRGGSGDADEIARGLKRKAAAWKA